MLLSGFGLGHMTVLFRYVWFYKRLNIVPVFVLSAVIFPSRASQPKLAWTSVAFSFVSFASAVAVFSPFLFRAFQSFPAFVPNSFSVFIFVMFFTCLNIYIMDIMFVGYILICVVELIVLVFEVMYLYVWSPDSCHGI